MLRDRVDLLIRIAFGAFILFGCFMVLQPFLTAIMFSAVLVVVSWPFYSKTYKRFIGHKTLTASLMIAIMIVTILIPIYILCAILAQQVPVVVHWVRDWVMAGMPLPQWLASLPYLGEGLQSLYTDGTINAKAVAQIFQTTVDPVTTWLVSVSLGVGNGLLQILLVAFISFFFYRDGDFLAAHIKKLLDKVSGELASEFSSILLNTTRSVVFGVIGTAIGQGLVAAVGFVIVDAPGVVLLSFAVCVLSVVPMGPPLVWAPVALWLYSTGSPGLAIFLCLWGILAVSSVDNFLKPLLISRGTRLPLALVFLGVFGGILSFGFLGLVLGPVFLAASMAMFQAWLRRPLRASRTGKPVAKKRLTAATQGEQAKSESADSKPIV